MFVPHSVQKGPLRDRVVQTEIEGYIRLGRSMSQSVCPFIEILSLLI